MVLKYLRNVKDFAQQVSNTPDITDALSPLSHYAVLHSSDAINLSLRNKIKGIPIPVSVNLDGDSFKVVFHPHESQHAPEYFAMLASAGIPVPLTVGVTYNGIHAGCLCEDLTRNGRYTVLPLRFFDGRWAVLDYSSEQNHDSLPDSFNLDVQAIVRKARTLSLPVPDDGLVVRIDARINTIRDFYFVEPHSEQNTDFMERLERAADRRDLRNIILNEKPERRVELWS
ncbi:hypothetical protein HY483_01520 [Candidatus Woesearchaeota archaeon]|nr:hypothetical protein [Candidatus Woesearchaeota archaeon]